MWAAALVLLAWLPACKEPDADGEETSDTRPGTGDPGGDPSGDPSGDPTDDPSGGEGGVLCDGADHTGEATYYAADGSGNCSFPAGPADFPMVAAMNAADYAASAACGACVQIDGPDGQIVVRIVDQCPECPQGDIDLAEAAFPMIAEPVLGRVPITWRYVSCATTGPIVYHFKDGSNEWWTAVQVRNHRNAIAKFEVMDAMGQWASVPRVDYNYFLRDSGMGPGPYSFRVTDVSGHVLEDSGVPLTPDGDATGSEQFPACG